MKNVKKIIAAALIAVLAVGATGCNMIVKTDEAIKNSVVAKFDNQKITRGQLDEEMTLYSAQFKTQYGENYATNSAWLTQKQQILDNMITQNIIYKKATEKNIAIKDEDVTKRIEEMKKDTDEALIKLYGYEKGYSDPRFKKDLKYQLTAEKLQEESTKDIKVEDSEVKNYYNSNKTAFTTEPNKYQVSRIVVATEEEAKKVKERLDKGEDFAALAKEVSTDTTSKDKGGDLGFIEYNDTKYGSLFMLTVMALGEGAVSAPFQDGTTWTIAKLVKKQEFPAKPFDDVKEDIKKSLLQQAQSSKFNETVTQWRNEAKIKLYEKNIG